MVSFLSQLWGSAATTVTIDDIIKARERISPHLPPTPLSISPQLSELAGLEIHVKWENYHRTGSFKERGACNFLYQLNSSERRRGVCAASLGNHALALSYHSKKAGIPCRLVMPATAPLIKVESCRNNGAEIIQVGGTFMEAYDAALDLAKETRAHFVSAFDDARIVAGQGTCGLEILEQLSEFDAIIVPMGGGGLLSGIALAIKHSRPKTFILGVHSDWVTKPPINKENQIFAGSSIADGIAVKRPGNVTLPIIEKHVDACVSLSEDEIASSIIHFLEAERSVVEGAGAVGIGAILKGALPRHLTKAVVIVSGSNIDMNLLSRLIERDMAKRGRLLQLKVSVPDRPGSLHILTGILAKSGANVLEVMHDRSSTDIPGNVEITFLVEVRNSDHKRAVVSDISNAGVSAVER